MLHARHADKRHATFDAALAMGGDYARDAKARPTHGLLLTPMTTNHES